ncbi:MAG: NifB/NifX family molybdenum-iron cluster-binding protein [Candidatus Brocadiae bacterium]|nr:NifB/NifX family molybdenum-iron cluster-binding protein [Candidatus Brocadiia bacterium]
MKIAIPLVGGRLAAHFGHCEEFALLEVGGEPPAVVASERLPAPGHQPGLLPQWLHEHGADVIIAGGMGSRAQGLFSQSGIEVVVGAPTEEPERIVEQYLAGSLQAGENICDH